MLRFLALAALTAVAVPAAAQNAPAPVDTEVEPAQTDDQNERINTSVRIASDAQVYFLRPTLGNGSFEGVTLDALEYAVDEHGRYVHRDGEATHTFALTEADGVVTITSTSDRFGGEIVTTVSGPAPTDIAIRL